MHPGNLNSERFCNQVTTRCGLAERLLQPGFFVVSTLVAFVLLAIKYVDVTRRFPGGGGVVSVADAAAGPWWGGLGGQLIMVDYFLTVAISAIAGLYYIDSVVHLGGNVLPATLAALAVLALLNIVGIKESAMVSLGLAVAALPVALLVASRGAPLPGIGGAAIGLALGALALMGLPAPAALTLHRLALLGALGVTLVGAR